MINEILNKIKSFKQIDPVKMSKGKFSVNFEFLQFVYDLIAKMGETSKKYNGYEKRLEIVKNQFGKITDIKKYLPTHLIPNEQILKMDKQKYFGTEDKDNKGIVTNIQTIKKEGDPNGENQSDLMIEKYKDFLSILKEDLRKTMDKNLTYSSDINDIEEERQYYLDKIKNVMVYCEKKKNTTISSESKAMLENIIKIVTYIPDDFK